MMQLSGSDLQNSKFTDLFPALQRVMLIGSSLQNDFQFETRINTKFGVSIDLNVIVKKFLFDNKKINSYFFSRYNRKGTPSK
jgi:hypothetical protein